MAGTDPQPTEEYCSQHVKLKLHIEYIGCYVLPNLQQGWPGMSAGVTFTLRIPTISEKYTSAFYQKGYTIEFAADFDGFSYNSLRIPTDMTTDIGKIIMMHNLNLL